MRLAIASTAAGLLLACLTPQVGVLEGGDLLRAAEVAALGMVEHMQLEHVGEPLGTLEDAAVGQVPIPVELAQLVLVVELADRQQLPGVAGMGRQSEVVDVDGD